LSDRFSGTPSLEQRIDDVRAIMDDIGSRQAVLWGFSEGSPMSALFAASHPDRVSHLILYGRYPKAYATKEMIEERVKIWGTGEMIKRVISDQAGNPEAVALYAKFQRLSASPGTYKAYVLLNALIDVRPILQSVRVPTLVLHRRTDAFVPVELGRSLAAQIPGAKFIEYPDGNHAF
jgi:pimeloyl-ACP methyl ester carboxylesterase